MAGTAGKFFCLPISMLIHGGDKIVRAWKGMDFSESNVARLAREACDLARNAGLSVYILADAAFFTVNVLLALQSVEGVDIVTRARITTKAFYALPPDNTDKRRKKGKEVKLERLFRTHESKFVRAEIEVYGKIKEVYYYEIDLVWGDGLYAPTKFILTKIDGNEFIIATTDMSMDPIKAIQLYCKRFKIETFFREAKQHHNAFGYHFWTPFLEAATKKKLSSRELEARTARSGDDEESRERILKTVDAIHKLIMINIIAIGILQLCSLKFPETIAASARWLRTPKAGCPSEDTTAVFVAERVFWFMENNPMSAMAQSVLAKRGPGKFFGKLRRKNNEQNAQNQAS